MSGLRATLAVLALVPGLWMSFDGARALIRGDYVTPSSGPYAGRLGPWARLVAAVGIPPRSIGMKVAFVVFGVAWLLSSVALLTRRPASERILAATAAATLWYAPVGTAIAVLELGGLLILLGRGGE